MVKKLGLSDPFDFFTNHLVSIPILDRKIKQKSERMPAWEDGLFFTFIAVFFILPNDRNTLSSFQLYE